MFSTTLQVVLWFQLSPWVAVARVTNLTFVPHALSWNDAREACHHTGGRLAEVKSKFKRDVVLHFVNESWDQYRTSQVTIGLASLTTGARDLYWAESCEPLTWSQFGTDAQSKFEAGRTCVKWIWHKEIWSPAYCMLSRPYMCEHISDENCPYDVRANVSLMSDGVSLKTITHEVRLADCYGICDDMTSEGVEACWAFGFSYNASETREPQCIIYVTVDPFLVDNSSYMYRTRGADWTLYIKRCYNAHLGKPHNLTGEPNTATEPQFSCSGGSTSVKGHSETTSVPGVLSQVSQSSISSIASMEIKKEDLPLTTSLPPSSTRPGPETRTNIPAVGTSQTSTQLQGQTSTLVQGQTSTLVQGQASTKLQGSTADDFITEMTVLSGNIEPSTYGPLSRTEWSKKEKEACKCPCGSTYLKDNTALLDLLDKLSIDKTRLSSSRRKYLSATDNRPIAVGMGCVGITLLTVIFGVIVLCDAKRVGPRCKGCVNRSH